VKGRVIERVIGRVIESGIESARASASAKEEGVCSRETMTMATVATMG